MRTILLVILSWAPAFAFTAATSSRGAELHWATPSVTLTLDPDAPSALGEARAAAALAAACAAWSNLPESKVALRVGPPSEGVRVNHVRFRQRDWPHGSEMLAYTVLEAHVQSGVVVSATIEVNEQHHLFSTDDEPGRDAEVYDLAAVLTHELGHVLGLGHSAELEATMYPSTAPWDTHQRQPIADDREGLAHLYAAVSFEEPAEAPATPAATQPAEMPPLATGRGCSVASSSGAGGAWPWLFALACLAWRQSRRHRRQPVDARLR